MRKLSLVTGLIFLLWVQVLPQSSYDDYVFFTDSPTPISYDPSWGFVNPPSYLERVGEKFPVDTVHVFRGQNSLKLHWISKPGGDWGFAVAEVGWPGHDVYLRDTLSFWVYSEDSIRSEHLPLIYLEDLSNRKTGRVSLSYYHGDIPDSQWVQIKVPLDTFYSIAGDVDLTKIKTIFYGQDMDDTIEHTMYIDEIRMYIGSQRDTTPPNPPEELTAKGYDKHVDIFWAPNTEEDVSFYNIYRSLTGSYYTLVGSVDKEFTIFSDYVGRQNQQVYYKITAVDRNYNESDFSDVVEASTVALSDEELLTMVQEATFRYFWDFAHPVSGMAYERIPGSKVVTIGGTGFGIMAILVGIERGFITREEGAQRVLKILNFLENADRFHGAFPHWMNGETGKVVPFSQYDNGGDLVETSYLMQGLLTARQYFNLDNDTEVQIRNKITTLWEEVEWDWYRRTETSNYLYWHWSPNYEWAMNMPIVGPNECMITYLLAIASPTHPIPASMYYDGWASSPDYYNGNTYYGYTLWVGRNTGGPLFFTHYSFLGFDPRYKKDSFANYFKNNRNQTFINRAYCIENPEGHTGYGENCWGLTACDDPLVGYLAHEPIPEKDNGTIAPTAALSSFPYTPGESMEALKYFYNELGDGLWGVCGFKDAFNLDLNWYAGSYLAIDQGPIIVMIENYRTQLLWNYFMSNPEISSMLEAIGFVPDSTDYVNEEFTYAAEFELIGNFPNPFNSVTKIKFNLPDKGLVSLTIYNYLGEKIYSLFKECGKGYGEIVWDGKDSTGNVVPSGIYFYVVEFDGMLNSGKMVILK